VGDGRHKEESSRSCTTRAARLSDSSQTPRGTGRKRKHSSTITMTPLSLEESNINPITPEDVFDMELVSSPQSAAHESAVPRAETAALESSCSKAASSESVAPQSAASKTTVTESVAPKSAVSQTVTAARIPESIAVAHDAEHNGDNGELMETKLQLQARMCLLMSPLQST